MPNRNLNPYPDADRNPSPRFTHLGIPVARFGVRGFVILAPHSAFRFLAFGPAPINAV